MNITMEFRLTGTKLVAEAIPFVAEGSRQAVQCRFAFDESWNGFARSVLVRSGEAEDALLSLPLVDDVCSLPVQLSATDTPFYLSVEGKTPGGVCRIRSNSVCVSFRSGEPDEPTALAYEGPYTVTENGDLGTAGLLLSGDLHVRVPQLDVSSDTVTADTLLEGYTAHDASENPIVGTYRPPAGGELNVSFSPTPPLQQTKLWAKTDAAFLPEQEIVSRIDPEKEITRFPITSNLPKLNTAVMNRLFFDGDGGCLVAQECEGGYTGLHQFSPDGTHTYRSVVYTGSAYDKSALGGCLVGDVNTGKLYCLLGKGAGTSSYRRALKLWRYDLANRTQWERTIDFDSSLTYTNMRGGICLMPDGETIYMYRRATTSAIYTTYTLRFFKYVMSGANGNAGTFTELGEEITLSANAATGGNGMALAADGKVYTAAMDLETGVGYRIDPETDTVETYPIDTATCKANDRAVIGAEGNFLRLIDDGSIAMLDVTKGVTVTLPIDRHEAEYGSYPYETLAWRRNGDNVFAVFRRSIDSAWNYYCAEFPCRKEQPTGCLVVTKKGGKTVTVLESEMLRIDAQTYAALVTDASGLYHPVPVFAFDPVSEEWKDLTRGF